MIIEPGFGTDLVRFGVSESRATKSVGVPDKVYFDESGRSRFQYNEQQVELIFKPDEGKLLERIEIYDPTAELFGRRLINQNQSEVLDFINKHLSAKPVFEDYGTYLIATFEQGNRLELCFQFARLTRISIAVSELSEISQPQWQPSPVNKAETVG